MADFRDKSVADTYARYPSQIRRQLLAIRKLILATAVAKDVGAIEECLKWGEPAYLTSSKSGTTLRLAWSPKRPKQFGLYVNCQTDLIERFRDMFGTTLTYEGNRGVVFQADDPLPLDKLATCISAALTYHRRKG